MFEPWLWVPFLLQVMKTEMGDADLSSDAQRAQVDCGVNQRLAAVCQAVARRMPSYLDNSEALKVGTKDLEDHVLASNETSVNIEHIVRQAKGEKQKKKRIQTFSRQGAKEILVASVARWEEHLRMLMVQGRERLDVSEAIGHLSERQELLATLMESKKCLQKGAPEGADLPRVEGAGGAEVKRGIGAVGTQAQVGKIGEGK